MFIGCKLYLISEAFNLLHKVCYLFLVYFFKHIFLFRMFGNVLDVLAAQKFHLGLGIFHSLHKSLDYIFTG